MILGHDLGHDFGAMMNILKTRQRFFRRIYHVFEDLLFPRYCEGCSKPMDHENRLYLCQHCRAQVVRIQEPACSICAKHFSGAPLDPGWVCSPCSRKKHPYRQCRAIFVYQGPLQQIVRNYKFNRAGYLEKTLQTLWMNALVEMNISWDYDVVIPVPLHPVKMKERGYNQAEVLARGWLQVKNKKSARATTRLHEVLRRVKFSSGQTLQGREERLENIKDSFALISSKASDVSGQRLLLIDDVFTTGATLHECAKTLQDAKPEVIDALVLARGE